MTPMDKLELQINESDDGSAVVDLPDEEGQVEQTGKSEYRTDDNFDDGGAVDEERQKIREQRREERRNKKVIHREKARESNALINSLKKQIEQLEERVAVSEKKTTGVELARMDKAIEDAGVQLEYAKMKLQEAVSTSNGELAIQANEMLYEAQRNIETLNGYKRQANQVQQRPNIQVPSTRTQELMAEWLDENPWYDPSKDSQERDITISIDKQLVRDGFNPESEDYWDELSYRVKKVLPEVANNGYNDNNNRNQRPRSVVTSSGRESASTSKGSSFILSPERVSAMKDSGAWNDPVRKKKMVEYYREFDRQNKGQQ
jgi:hypothetical protein